nr:uncharacterized protein LOC112743013 [Arachis hypogaea]
MGKGRKHGAGGRHCRRATVLHQGGRVSEQTDTRGRGSCRHGRPGEAPEKLLRGPESAFNSPPFRLQLLSPSCRRCREVALHPPPSSRGLCVATVAPRRGAVSSSFSHHQSRDARGRWTLPEAPCRRRCLCCRCRRRHSRVPPSEMVQFAVNGAGWGCSKAFPLLPAPGCRSSRRSCCPKLRCRRWRTLPLICRSFWPPPELLPGRFEIVVASLCCFVLLWLLRT